VEIPTSSASSLDRKSLIRLVGAVRAEQHDESTEMRSKIGLEVSRQSRMTVVAGEAISNEVLPQRSPHNIQQRIMRCCQTRRSKTDCTLD
jgi:hypothetical protein